MAQYLEFPSRGGSVFVEVQDAGETISQPPIEKASGTERAARALSTATETLEIAVTQTIQNSLGAFIDALDGTVPVGAEVDLSFGLSASGELQAFSVAKAASEASYTVRVTWKAGG